MCFERRLVLIAAIFAASCGAANLTYSTYLRSGFQPTAIASDAQGNLYLAGQVVTDPASGATTAAVAKLDPRASQYLYFVYLDGAASDSVGAIAVDSAGNAYVTGATSNPLFPATGGKFATPSANAQDSRPFVTKLSPSGTVLFSVLVGGSVSSVGEAIALTPQGNILISGVSNGSGFPVTTGAYSVKDSKQHPFLMEIDAAASNVVFSATGIGGSSIALDAIGNIFVSGSTTALDYPTTPGAYQTTFPPAYICGGLCQVSSPGLQQYVSKVDPTGSRLIYSTGLNGTGESRSATTRNLGLAVDAAGNAYVTGVVTGSYPFTTPPPANAPYQFGYLSKLNVTGSNLIFSIPAGGGVQLDSSGALYAAGAVTSYNPGVFPPITAVGVFPPLNSVPSQCLPDNVAAYSEAYVLRLDPGSGTVLDAQFVDGTSLAMAGVTLASGKAWIAGATQLADVPLTPDTLGEQPLAAGLLPGAYLSAVDFSAPARSVQIACALDGGNLMHTGVVAPKQLLTLFGSNLDRASITLDGAPVQVLYSSPSQVNLVVGGAVSQKTILQVTADGAVAATRQFAVVRSNPNLLVERSDSSTDCLGGPSAHTLVAFNADGSRNTCANPAKLGSMVSLYAHGVASPGCYCFDVAFGGRSVAVVNATPAGDLLTRIDIQVPDTLDSASTVRTVPKPVLGRFELSITLGDLAVGPLALHTSNITNAAGALAIYVTP